MPQPTNPICHAYLITVYPSDSERVITLQNRLVQHGFHVSIVVGVKGADLLAGDYFRKTLFWSSHTGHMMTPGELGCTLSHQKALRLAASIPGPAHLILEDDFEASDRALAWIRIVSNQLPDRTLLHLGGQEGLKRYYRYLRGQPSATIENTVELRPEDLRFLNRTVAYMVSAETAAAMALTIENGAMVMDDMHYWHQKGAFERVFFRWVVSHPTDLENSTIENERRAVKPVPWELKSWKNLTYRRRMQLALIWRKITTHPKDFLENQQKSNQLPN